MNRPPRAGQLAVSLRRITLTPLGSSGLEYLQPWVDGSSTLLANRVSALTVMHHDALVCIAELEAYANMSGMGSVREIIRAFRERHGEHIKQHERGTPQDLEAFLLQCLFKVLVELAHLLPLLHVIDMTIISMQKEPRLRILEILYAVDDWRAIAVI